GVVLGVRTQMTRRGKMAIVTLDDASAQVEISVFNELWDAERSKVREDELLLVEGKVQKDDYSGGLRVTADKLMTLAEARGRHARVLKLALNGTSSAAACRLRTLLAQYRCTERATDNVCPVRICYRNAAAETELTLPDAWRVRLEDGLIDALNDWLKPENVRVIYG
ncbi:MAG: OB-fold nucleic acid binding domain-containing protein, partial [Rhodocyclaceae bacterium]|nr:OB-fold nucleic acid binding domain-containing protein [Rhodocyclaceae bacterium]